MSILVKGMEMPQSCSDCPCASSGFAVKICNIKKQIISDPSKVSNNCPLIPVPPHGDLIDRSKLRESGAWVRGGFGGSNHLTYYSVREIDNAPVIIPADKEAGG